MLSIKLNETIIDCMQSNIAHLRAVWLFGSYAKQTSNASSDIDIAILTEWTRPKISPIQLWELSQKLACILNSDVDILDMHRASTVMQYQVVVHGIRIFGHGLDIDLFEVGILSQKIALNALRATYMDDIAARGFVYAR